MWLKASKIGKRQSIQCCYNNTKLSKSTKQKTPDTLTIFRHTCKRQNFIQINSVQPFIKLTSIEKCEAFIKLIKLLQLVLDTLTM